MKKDYSNISYENFKIRGPIVDGIFYSDDDLLLHNKVEHLLEISQIEPGKAAGIISPHAALAFSGELAASSFQSAAAREIDKVIIIAPVHRDHADKIFLTESDFFTIPTANIKVDKTAIEKLLNFNSVFQLNDIPHLEEHCIEIQLPFIAHLFPEAEIIPILIGNNSSKLSKTLVDGLQTVFNNNFDKTLIVASSNIVSYMEAETANQYFDFLINLLKTGNSSDIQKEVDQSKSKSKGLSSIASVISLIADESIVKVLGTKNSAKKGNNSGKIVCYASLTVEKKL